MDLPNFRRLVVIIVNAMPDEFDAHQAQQWYKANYPQQFREDLAYYCGNEHTFAIQLSKAIDRQPNLRQFGKSSPTVNMRSGLSVCTKWRKVAVAA